MGAVFFMLLLALVFCVAVFLIAASIIVIVIWKVRKRKGKNPAKWQLVIPVILLIVNVIATLLPLGYLGFLRFANSANQTAAVYAESGKMLVWPLGEHGPTRAYFEMDGVKYVRFREGFSDEPFFLEYGGERLGEPVANIQNNPAATNAFNEFMTWLLTGSTTDKLSVTTIFPIMNDNGFALYHCGNAGTNTYCPADEIDAIKAYYMDIANYDTQNVTVDYYLSADGESSDRQSGKREVTLAPNVFFELRQMYDDEQKLERFARDETVASETRRLSVYSKDKMAFRQVWLYLSGDRVYVLQTTAGAYIEGYPLSAEMNRYIIKTVFQ